MSPIGEGVWGYVVLALVCALAHEPWRWVGLWIGGGLSVEGEAIRWVRAVSTALVAALVVRLVLFPAGVLEQVHLAARLGAFAAGVAVFYALKRNLAAGVASGAALLALAKQLTG